MALCEELLHLPKRVFGYFALEAARDKALDVFYHPFYYAASRPAPHTSQLLAA